MNGLTWEEVGRRTGYSVDDLRALSADWIGETGYLDDQGQPTRTALDLLLDQAAHDLTTGRVIRWDAELPGWAVAP
ncbi:MAG: hypothetical protein ACYCYA_10405 [Actinomycetes bacterium]